MFPFKFMLNYRGRNISIKCFFTLESNSCCVLPLQKKYMHHKQPFAMDVQEHKVKTKITDWFSFDIFKIKLRRAEDCSCSLPLPKAYAIVTDCFNFRIREF